MINSIVINVVSSTVMWRRYPETLASPISWVLQLLLLALLPLQLWALNRRPILYMRHRTWIIWLLRLLRVVIIYLSYTQKTWQDSLHAIATRPSSSPLRSAAFHLAGFAGLTNLNCLNLPLPFRQQAAAAGLMNLVALRYGVPCTSCALQQPQSQLVAASERLCGASIGGIVALGQLLAPVHAPGEELQLCKGPRSVLLACLFITLYVGWVIPVSLTYWYEQRVKLAFYRLRYGEEPAGAPGERGRLLAWLCFWGPVCCVLAELMAGWELYDLRRCSWHTGQPGR